MTWQRAAACRHYDPDLWFPEAGQSRTAARAQAICSTCPVIADCAAEVQRLPQLQRVGIWAGVNQHAARRGRVAS